MYIVVFSIYIIEHSAGVCHEICVEKG